MNRWIQTCALIAALAVIVAALWQDWGLVTTVKRLVVAYLGFFFLGGLAALAVRAGAPEDRRAEERARGRDRGAA